MMTPVHNIDIATTAFGLEDVVLFNLNFSDISLVDP
jgi:hypothetical protein